MVNALAPFRTLAEADLAVGLWHHPSTLWRWLDRAVNLGLAERVGEGTKTHPYRFVLTR
jgi:hypothetical protein